MIDEESARRIDSGTDLSELPFGWHNIIIMCDNMNISGEGAVRFYVNG